MDKEVFIPEVQQALQNLYDYVGLNHSPLKSLISQELNQSGESAGKVLQREILQAIEAIKPNSDTPAGSYALRTYDILCLRFIQCLQAKEISTQFQISDRQIRREITRAVEAVAEVLWERWKVDLIIPPQPFSSSTASEDVHYKVHAQSLDLSILCKEVVDLFSRLPQAKAITFKVPEELPYINADRVLVRQILLMALKAASEAPGDEVRISVEVEQGSVILHLSSWPATPSWNIEPLRKLMRSLSKHELGLEYQENVEGASITFRFPQLNWKTILLIDDDNSSFQLYKRYLAGCPYKLINLGESDSAFACIDRELPDIILLDVLLPDVDGWEILQSLKRSSKTSAIPVVICSAWGDPEIAMSLKADGVLKKPILQKEFLVMLERFL